MSSASQQYHDLIFDRIRIALAGFTPELIDDTYALAIVFDTVKVSSGQVLQAAIEFTYNTTTQWKSACSAEFAEAEQAYLAKVQKIADMKAHRTPAVPRQFVSVDDPLRPGTVKWAYIYWCHDVRARIPRLDRNGFTDPLDQAIREDWCRDLGVPQVGIDWTDRPTYDEAALADATLKLCGSVVKSLHGSGLIQKRFGKPIPVFLHSLSGTECGDTLATVMASNPLEAIAEFLWHREEVREHNRALLPPQLARTIQVAGLEDELLPDGSNPTIALRGMINSPDHLMRRER